jgi:hypothetical protein
MSPSKRQFQRADATIDRAVYTVVDTILDHRDAVAPQYMIEQFLLTLIARPGFMDTLAKQQGDASVRLLNALLDYRDAQWKERGLIASPVTRLSHACHTRRSASWSAGTHRPPQCRTLACFG